MDRCSARPRHSRSGLLGAVGGAVSGVGGFVGTVITNVVGGVLEGARCGVKLRISLWLCDNLQTDSMLCIAMHCYAACDASLIL